MEKNVNPYKYEIVVTKCYNPNYGDDRVCICGCVYTDHFVPWYETSTTYNGCDNFIELPPGQITPDEARDKGKCDALDGKEFDHYYSTVNRFVKEAYQKGYERDSTPSEDLVIDLFNANIMKDGDYLEFGDDDPWNDLEL